MIVLDSDHFSLLRYPESPGHSLLASRMTASPDQRFVTTIVTVEEQMRGWLALIARARDVTRQVTAYERLGQLIDSLAAWEVLPFTREAAAEFERLRRQKVRIGSQDLKIASIAVTNNALLLTANRRDFDAIPGLRFENWIRLAKPNDEDH